MNTKKMKLFLKKKSNLGMTYVELIVVMSILSVMSAIVLFNYRDFQSRIEVKSLSNEIAQKVVQAQKFAMSGESVVGSTSFNSAPAYGVYFDKVSFPKKFAYFADLNNNLSYEGSLSSCSTGEECLEIVDINRDYFISNMKVVFLHDSCSVEGGGGTGSGGGNNGGEEVGKCISEKQAIAEKYGLTYSPSDGFFKGNDGEINPNAGLYPYENIFVELNSGAGYQIDNLTLRVFSINGKKVQLYEIQDGVAIDPISGYYIDLNTGDPKFIPSKQPVNCNAKKDGGNGGFSLGDSQNTEPSIVSELSINSLSVVFKRPDSKANILYSPNPYSECTPSYAEVQLSSSSSAGSKIQIYPSGRVQIK